MTISELAKVVLAYAANRAEPFTSYQAYNDIEEFKDKNLVSDTLGFLYRKGMLARQKTTEGRFMYALPHKAPLGYETLQIKEERTTAVLNSEKTDIKPKTRNVKETPVVLDRKEIETKDIALPNVFLITLKAPGGIEITISSGSSQ